MQLTQPTSIAFYDIDDQVIAHADNLHAGWNLLAPNRIGLGAWVWEDCMLVCNACPGAGVFNFAYARVMFPNGTVAHAVLERFAWTPDDFGALKIGNGHECMVPRGCFVVRWKWNFSAPSRVAYGSVFVNWHPSQRINVFDPLVASIKHDRGLGMYQPFGEAYTAPPGATNRNSVVGWEQDGNGLVLRSDLVIERMPIACLSPSTGLPMVVPHEDYHGTRGYGKTTQLAAFCKPSLSPIGHDEREPRVTSRGTCSYTKQLLGDPRDNSYGPFDDQHLGNVLGHVIAAAQCEDSAALFFLGCLANDVRMFALDSSSEPNGSRGLAWSIEALLHWEPTWDLGKSLCVRNSDAQIDSSGAVLRAPPGYPFSPIPQSYGMPADWDSDQLMERWLSCIPMGRVGYVHFIRQAAIGAPRPYAKFIGVGKDNGATIFPQGQHPCGPGDFFGDIVIGLLAALQTRDPLWQQLALEQPMPGTDYDTFTPYANLQARLNAMRHQTTGLEQSAVLRSVLESMSARQLL